jgi:hypothetical protein
MVQIFQNAKIYDAKNFKFIIALLLEDIMLFLHCAAESSPTLDKAD